MKNLTLMPKNKDSRLSSFINDFFEDEIFRSVPLLSRTLSNYYLPLTNISENSTEIKLNLSVPGIDKKDIKVQVDNNVLTISYNHSDKNEEKNDSVLRTEFKYSSFSRSFSLPEHVDSEKIESKMENGILTVSLPKTEVKSSSKNIEVK